MIQKKILEIACFNIQSALIAEKAGADRIEFCDNYSLGGISPGIDSIKQLISKLGIGLFAMIRPRAGNFIYSETELDQMKKEITECKNLGIEGIVFGILTEKKLIHKEICKEFVALAYPMKSTFHRAFDQIENSANALETLIECGFSRVLTSGKEETALKGYALLSELTDLAKDRIVVMPGGGIRSENISEIQKKTKAKEFHSAALNTKSMLADPDEITRMKLRLIL